MGSGRIGRHAYHNVCAVFPPTRPRQKHHRWGSLLRCATKPTKLILSSYSVEPAKTVSTQCMMLQPRSPSSFAYNVQLMKACNAKTSCYQLWLVLLRACLIFVYHDRTLFVDMGRQLSKLVLWMAPELRAFEIPSSRFMWRTSKPYERLLRWIAEACYSAKSCLVGSMQCEYRALLHTHVCLYRRYQRQLLPFSTHSCQSLFKRNLQLSFDNDSYVAWSIFRQP